MNIFLKYSALAVFFFGIQAINAQKTTLKEELLKGLNDQGFEEFVININKLLEKVPSMIEDEVKKRELICEKDNELEELRFIKPRLQNRIYTPSVLSILMKNYIKSFSFKQTFEAQGSYVHLIPNYKIEDSIGIYIRSGIGLKTIIHSITYDDGSVLVEQITFQNTYLKIPSIKKISEIKTTVTLEYPKVKIHTITKKNEKISEGNEYLTIHFKQNKVQISVPEDNTDFLTLNTSQHFDAIHKTKKPLLPLSSSHQKALDDKSFNNLKTSIRVLEKALRKIKAGKISSSNEVIEAIDEIPDVGLASNWNINKCYYGNVDKVLFYYNTGNHKSVTQKMTLKASNSISQ